MNRLIGFLLLILMAGCATTPKPLSGRSPETVTEQLTAAQKVMGAMAGREVSDKEMKRVVTDVQQGGEARTAVRAIVGANAPVRPVVKYSPVTGKHYSGELDVDPETGAKLLPLPE
ncbi:MAG: hypothetical protein HQL19_00430 [Candidatus Omnitrophica bacterium]|nr:hypothetical protein [Candidatus Omnitrophota bacterium]